MHNVHDFPSRQLRDGVTEMLRGVLGGCSDRPGGAHLEVHRGCVLEQEVEPLLTRAQLALGVKRSRAPVRFLAPRTFSRLTVALALHGRYNRSKRLADPMCTQRS